jgi:uncharacterized membrane protein (DUF106 family)
MDVIWGILILLLGVVVIVFSKRMAEWETKLLPEGFAPFESLGRWFYIIVGVIWIIFGIYLLFSR